MPSMRDTCMLFCKDTTLERAELFENNYIPLRGGNSVVACVVPTSRSESRSFRRGGDTSSCRNARNTNSLGVRDSLRASLITRRLLRSNADRKELQNGMESRRKMGVHTWV